jgi:hypothetical protein
MRTTAPTPVTTPMPVPLSAPECAAFLVPPLSLPTRGPKGTLGDDRVLHLLVWGRSTGMPWQCLPVPPEPEGPPAIHDTTGSRGWARGADEGARWPAFGARVRPLAVEKPRARRVLQGDGTPTVAQKGGLGGGIRVQTPDRGEAQRHAGEPWRRLRARSRGAWQCHRPGPVTAGPASAAQGGPSGWVRAPWRRPQPCGRLGVRPHAAGHLQGGADAEPHRAAA